MIHNSWTLGMGDKDEMQKQVDLMGKIDEMMAEIYTNCIEKSGKLIDGNKDKTKKKVLKMMQEETWLTAEEAKEFGLINEVVETPTKESTDYQMQAAVIGRIRAQASNFKHIPQELNNNNMQNDKKGWLAKIAAAFGFTPSDIKAELEAIEAPKDVDNAKETENTEAEAVTDDQKAEEAKAVDSEGLTAEIEALKAELAAQKAQNEALSAKVTELEVKAKTKHPVSNQPKEKTEEKGGVITPELKAQMDSYFKTVKF